MVYKYLIGHKLPNTLRNVIVFFGFFWSTIVCAQISSSDFVTTWNTDNPGIANGNNDSLIFIRASDTNYTFHYDVDWNNDGIFDTLGVQGSISHQYQAPGIYTIRIRGDFPRIEFGGVFQIGVNYRYAKKLVSIDQWGTIKWKRLNGAFKYCENLNIQAVDAPILDSLEYHGFDSTFFGCKSLNASLNNWDVSGITSLTSTFEDATIFDGNISAWDVSSVSTINSMFRGALEFNQPLANWDVSSVTDMSLMFFWAPRFNQPINGWDVSGVTDMNLMFAYDTAFNQALNNWNVSSVENMAGMFLKASSFNQNLNSWIVANIVSFSGMFEDAINFNQPLDNWDVSSALYFRQMFFGATNFNQPLNSWDFSSAIDAVQMFRNAISFNQPLNNWDVSNLKQVWFMFSGATSFNQSLGSWQIHTFLGLPNFLDNSGLSTENYDSTLIGWANNNPPANFGLGAAGLKYCNSLPKRNVLLGLGWNIQGDTFDPNCSLISINENVIQSESASVFPNPSSGSFTVQFSAQPFKGNMEIYSICGQLVHQQSIESQMLLELDLELANGVYILKLSSQNQNLTERLIIQ